MLFMGLDAGTQGVRGIVCDETGAPAAVASVAFSRINIADEKDRYEQSAHDWWSAAERVIASIVAQLKQKGFACEDIAAISVDGTSGTIVPLDSGGRPLSNALMYNDMRAKGQAGLVHEALGGLEKKLGLTFNASFSLPRILWIKQNMPDVYEKTVRFAHQADYIVGMLSGEFGISDYSNALKTGYDLIEGRWPDGLALLGLDSEKLPDIVPPGAPVAQVSSIAARSLGLSEKTLIVGGSTDGYASALAAGAVRVGDWASILGTTLVLKGVTKRLVIDPSGSGYSHRLPGGSWMFGGAANMGGRCMAELFDKTEFAPLNATVDELSPTGVISFPLVGTGERFPFLDPSAKAFTLGDVSDRRVHYASLMEGVAFAERLALERMEALGCAVGGVVFVSGGACRSDEWLRIRASVLNRQLKAPMIVDAAMGSALLAASHSFGSLEQAASLIRFERHIDPVGEKVERFDELYREFYAQCKARYDLGDIS